MSFKDILKQKQVLINKELKKYLSPKHLKVPSLLGDALRYCVLSGGKRFRPVLMLMTAEALMKDAETVLPAACAVEFVHNFSLIHDDMPCMDNDDYRRGRLTCHKKFNEEIALLAGDELLAHAFKLVVGAGVTSNESPRPYNFKIKEKDLVKIVDELSEATSKMICGQVKDITVKPDEINDASLTYIHSHKTGALIRCSVRIGAILSGARPSQLHRLTLYAQNIGLIFQITDDILDFETESGKVSFPAFYGLSESKKMLAQFAEDALENLKGFPKKADNLRNIVHYLLNRNK